MSAVILPFVVMVSLTFVVMVSLSNHDEPSLHKKEVAKLTTSYSIAFIKNYKSLPWHCLNFLPLPQGQGSFLPILGSTLTGSCFTIGAPEGSKESFSLAP